MLKADSRAARIRCATCKSEFPAALASAPPPARKPARAGVAAGVCVLAVIGLVMSLQPVSLMSGSVTVWLGVAIIGAATAAAFFLRGPTWVRIAAPIVLAVALLNALAIEHDMSDKRDQISRDLRS